MVLSVVVVKFVIIPKYIVTHSKVIQENTIYTSDVGHLAKDDLWYIHILNATPDMRIQTELLFCKTSAEPILPTTFIMKGEHNEQWKI